MKILHIEAGMHLYGGALQVVFLMRGLRELGVANVLACPTGSAIAGAGAAHATVCEMPMRGDADWGLVARLRALIRRERPDVVHLHSRRGCDTWGALAARLEGVAVVLSRRVDNPESRLWVALKYRLYDRVVTISEGIYKVLGDEGVPAGKLRCVRSAVDTEQFRPNRQHLNEVRQALGWGDGNLVVGMVAQFIERKGHAVLLDALPQVLRTCPHLKVVLFGQGPLLAAITERIQREGLSEAVKLAGFRKDLERILPCLDLLVHPAYMEGLGVSLLQAAACGLPLIACDAGGLPEIVRPGLTGTLIPVGDSKALATAMLALLEQPELRQRYGQAARAWVEANFSITAMVQGNLAVYGELLPPRP